jgi:DNA repair photolyase
MLEPLWGEFFTSPIPLELSLNFCSHKCSYCFANLNKPEREADIPKIVRNIKDHLNRTSVPARLLQECYPVLLSNKVDPFANSNYRVTLPLLELLVEHDIPVALQTRGGRGVDEAIRLLPPSCWYVSICHVDDALRRRHEPGAPSIESRFELIAQLRAAGHRVVAALNPLVPAWIPDPAPVLERLRAAGAEGVWIETLHLSADQIAKMTARERAALGEPLLQLSRKRRPSPTWAAHRDLAMRLAHEIGTPPFAAGYHRPTAFWRPYEETYPFLFPTVQGLVNHAHETLADLDVLDFATFEAWALDLLPFADEPANLTHYIGATAREVVRGMPSAISYRDLLRLVWSEPRLSGCPARARCFAFAGRRDAAGWTGYVDYAGMPLMVFTASETGFDDYYAETPALAA